MNRWLRWGILAGVLLLHGIVLLTVSITTRVQEQREDTTILKMVDVREYQPPVPPPPEEKPEPPPPEQQMIVTDQPAEIVLETEDEILAIPPPPPPREPDFLPQHRISRAPEIPTEEIRSRVEYPVLANRQGIEGVVYLELFIDEAGVIHRIDILREPGYGLGAAAAAAFDGITVRPAESNGRAVAVRFRYPVRFQLR